MGSSQHSNPEGKIVDLRLRPGGFLILSDNETALGFSMDETEEATLLTGGVTQYPSFYEPVSVSPDNLVAIAQPGCELNMGYFE